MSEAASAQAAIEAIGRSLHDLVFLDIRLGTQSGLDLIPQLLAEKSQRRDCHHHRLRDVRHRGRGDAAGRVRLPAQAVHARADPPLLASADDAARADGAARGPGGPACETDAPEVDLETASPAMRGVLDVVRPGRHVRRGGAAARRERHRQGGAGARAARSRARGATRPFVTVNCPTLSEELLASELFGHARGAFTGAVQDQPGRVEAAEGARCSWTRSARCPPALQAQAAALPAGEAVRAGRRDARRARRTCGWWRRRTATWRRRARPGASARTCSTG